MSQGSNAPSMRARGVAPSLPTAALAAPSATRSQATPSEFSLSASVASVVSAGSDAPSMRTREASRALASASLAARVAAAIAPPPPPAPPAMDPKVLKRKVAALEKALKASVYSKTSSSSSNQRRVVESAFKSFDSDADGGVDFDEFCTALERFGLFIDGRRKGKGGLEEAVAKALFVTYDSDGSGAISGKEFAARLFREEEDEEDLSGGLPGVPPQQQPARQTHTPGPKSSRAPPPLQRAATSPQLVSAAASPAVQPAETAAPPPPPPAATDAGPSATVAPIANAEAATQAPAPRAQRSRRSEINPARARQIEDHCRALTSEVVSIGDTLFYANLARQTELTDEEREAKLKGISMSKWGILERDLVTPRMGRDAPQNESSRAAARALLPSPPSTPSPLPGEEARPPTLQPATTRGGLPLLRVFWYGGREAAWFVETPLRLAACSRVSGLSESVLHCSVARSVRWLSSRPGRAVRRGWRGSARCEPSE